MNLGWLKIVGLGSIIRVNLNPNPNPIIWIKTLNKTY